MNRIKQWFKNLFSRKKHVCTGDPGIDCLLAVIRVIARAAKGTLLFSNPVAAVLVYGSMLPDVFKLITECDDLPCEITELKPDKYSEILKTIVTEFGFGHEQAREVIVKAIEVVSAVTGAAPKLEELLRTIQGK